MEITRLEETGLAETTAEMDTQAQTTFQKAPVTIQGQGPRTEVTQARAPPHQGPWQPSRWKQSFLQCLSTTCSCRGIWHMV